MFFYNNGFQNNPVIFRITNKLALMKHNEIGGAYNMHGKDNT
jgi:hypothetical protein